MTIVYQAAGDGLARGFRQGEGSYGNGELFSIRAIAEASVTVARRAFFPHRLRRRFQDRVRWQGKSGPSVGAGVGAT
ncbi:MAG: hypothetical protein IPO22_13580 [Anaerolineales bacterium]|nr:hypothetical protein [Anaerolineales bacterium]